MQRSLYTLLLFLGIGYYASSQALVSRIEAENAQLIGLEKQFIGDGSNGAYVTGFDQDGDRLYFEVAVSRKAIYRLFITYRTLSGTKIQDLYVATDLVANIHFPESSDFKKLDVGGILLQKGINTITFQKKGGNIDIDDFSFYTSELHVYDHVSPSLIDPKASLTAQNLYGYIKSQYGHKIISGQTDGYYNSVKELTGRSPMLISFDMASYSPQYAYKWNATNGGHMFGAVNLNVMEKAIAWYQNTKKRGIVSLQWHWFSPAGGTLSTNTFAVENTTFDASKAVVAGTDEYALILRDIDSIAVQLKKLDKANIPVLWRPLHQAGSGRFWWGAKGPNVTKALYDIMYERLTIHHQLHNLIWVWSSPETDWYPGNDKVDIVGFDSYPGAYIHTTQKAKFDLLFDLVKGEKLVALCENGPIPHINDCLESDAPWAYFMTWSDLVYSENTVEHVQEVYAHPSVITLESTPMAITHAVDYLQDSESQVYPNPTSDRVRLPKALHAERVEVYTLDGSLKQDWEGHVQELSLGNLPNGIYLMKVYAEGQIYLQKILKI